MSFSQRECALAEWEVERTKRKDKLEVLQTQISLSRRNSDISQRSALKNLGEADSNQGYRNRYNLIDRLMSVSFHFSFFGQSDQKRKNQLSSLFIFCIENLHFTGK